MDSPSNALTNVLKIVSASTFLFIYFRKKKKKRKKSEYPCSLSRQDNLSHVPYSIYTPIESESVPLTDWQSDILRDAERSLKADGVPVFLDLENGRLWVFHISGLVAKAPVGEEEGEVLVPPATAAPGKDDRWLQIERRLVEEWRLKGEFWSSPPTPRDKQPDSWMVRIFQPCLPRVVTCALSLYSRDRN